MPKRQPHPHPHPPQNDIFNIHFWLSKAPLNSFQLHFLSDGIGGFGGAHWGHPPPHPGAMLVPLSGKIMGYYLYILNIFQFIKLLQRPHLRLPMNTIVPALYAYVNNYLMY